MKKIISIIAFVLFSCSIINAQEHIKIKNIPIDGNITTFIAKMKAAGLKHYSGTGRDEVLEGKFAGMNDCKFIFAGSPKTNTVFRVAIMTDEAISWSSLKIKYKSIKENYIQKYPSNESFEFFENPYYEGDGYELQALRLEKCTYVTYFDAPGGTIAVEMQAFSSGGGGYVLITYEDKINFEKAKEERNSTIVDDI